MLLSRVRKRFTTKENVCEDDKARRGKGTSSKTTLLTSSFTSSSKTILPLLLVCFSFSFLPSSSSSRVFSPFPCSPKRRRRSERITHVRNVCWSSSPRKNNTMLCYILSLSLVCATNERCAHLYQYLLLSRNDDVGQNPKKKQAEEAGKRAKAAKASSEREDDSGTPKKSPGEIRLAKGIYTSPLLLSPRIF